MGVLDIVPVSSILQTLGSAEVVFIQAGVLTGDNVRKLFDYAKENKVSKFLFGSYLYWRVVNK